jgi:hypothetical protein
VTWLRVGGRSTAPSATKRMIVSASPIPEHSVVELPRKRGGWAWYLWVGDELYGSIRGEEAEAVMERRLRELDELYEAVEADARRHGYSVQW